MYKRVNIMKKVLAVASGAADSFGDDQDFRSWAGSHHLDITALNSVNPVSKKAMMLACK